LELLKKNEKTSFVFLFLKKVNQVVLRKRIFANSLPLSTPPFTHEREEKRKKSRNKSKLIKRKSYTTKSLDAKPAIRGG